jgi:hypothetical protein
LEEAATSRGTAAITSPSAKANATTFVFLLIMSRSVSETLAS